MEITMQLLNERGEPVTIRSVDEWNDFADNFQAYQDELAKKMLSDSLTEAERAEREYDNLLRDIVPYILRETDKKLSLLVEKEKAERRRAKATEILNRDRSV